MPDDFRTAHGAAREGGRLTASECKPWDEQSGPTVNGADTDGQQRSDHGHFAVGNTVAASKRHRSGPTGRLALLESQGAPDWQAAARNGRRLSRARRAEMAQLHGGKLSSGPSLLVDRASQRYADAAYLRAKGRATGDYKLVLYASKLEREAAADMRDAWQLAALESKTRSHDQPYPWELPEGEDKSE